MDDSSAALFIYLFIFENSCIWYTVIITLRFALRITPLLHVSKPRKTKRSYRAHRRNIMCVR